MYYYNLYVEGIDIGFYTYMSSKKIEIGQWVYVNFRNRKKVGLIVEELSKKPNYNIKEIVKENNYYPVLDEKLVFLFLWISEYYLSKFSEIIKTFLPKGYGEKKTEVVKVINNIKTINNEENEIINHIQRYKIIKLDTLKDRFKETVINRLLKKKIIKIFNDVVEKKLHYKLDESSFEINDTTNLNEDQNKVYNYILNCEKRYYLIHGITGSGKTEVYIKLIIEYIKQDKGVIFLVPEISLTPQMIKRFKEVFGDSIAILHSRMTDSERLNEWININKGRKKIVIGVRSAIFAPVRNLGLIIIDEEHENTYKQDSKPRYNAKYVALKRAELEKLKVVLGSATPSIESFYYAKSNNFELLQLKKRFNKNLLPEINIINMKNQEKYSYFSLELLNEIDKRLEKKEQVLIFINKKGFSGYVQCRDCGYIFRCKKCSVSMVYFRGEKKLKCNYCGKEKSYIEKCEKCSSSNLSYNIAGTEKIEEELQKHFEEAKILRVDSETVKKRESYNKIYNDFLNEKYNIMVGTQIIAKGYNFPNITLVGIISADNMLNFPDFRAGEKTFQLLVQASGRAGRGEKIGKVIIQTFTPDHYVIEKAIKHDFEGFYNEEIKFRKELEYPPFGKIINIIISSTKEEMLENKSVEIYKFLNERKLNIDIFGPFKAPIYKIKNRYRYQIFIKGERKLINTIKEDLNNLNGLIDKKRFRVIIDIDPINLM